jgi:crotonobetainyl-CoA:carnitine CoA-transferase CaiB-like acyl-CoA transferase
MRRGRAEWLALCQAARIPAGPINAIDEVAADETLRARGLFYSLRVPGREIPQVGTGIILDGEANSPRLPPPGLGEHTEAVLSSLLALDEAAIASLRAAKAI